MKKLLSLLLTLSLLGTGTALADTNITPDGGSGSTTVTYTVPEPATTSYTVIIPSTLTIEPHATSTALDIQLTQVANANRISITTDASGSMINGSDGTIDFSVSPYSLSFRTFSSLPSIQTMTINITEEEWQQAAPGTYTGTMSFTISAQ